MTDDSTATLGIGMVGYSFMGVMHSHAWRNVRSFFDVPLVPRLAVLAGRNTEAAAAVAGKFGWESTESDWRALLDRDDVDLIDVCTPGDTHAEIAIAALEAGKHVLCEKPLANSVSEAAEMVAAAARARQAGVRSLVGFTYRRVPAIVLARNLVADGRLGEIRHVRAQYLQDWLVDPNAPMSWRLEKARAGSGALGDIGAHVVDLTRFITGEEVSGVCALMETFIKQRPVAEPDSAVKLGGHVEGGDAPLGDVTVDDAAVFVARLSGGALATFEATRFATGRKNAIRIEINGSRGALAFDFEDMNVLNFYDGTESSQTAGFRRILVTEPDHPYLEAWWPPGHVLGYEHGFTHQALDLVTAVAGGNDPEPSFEEGLRVQQVMAAVEQSVANESSWTEVGEAGL
jgi:predicted dehydrogenase